MSMAFNVQRSVFGVRRGRVALPRDRRGTSIRREHALLHVLWTCYAGRAGVHLPSEALHRTLPSKVRRRIALERVPCHTRAGRTPNAEPEPEPRTRPPNSELRTRAPE